MSAASATMSRARRETLAALPRVGEFGKLFTEMLVSEDAIRLVGFANEAERDWFRLLDNGAGCRHPGGARGPVDAQHQRARHGHRLRRQGDGRPRPGVGPKLAQRIVSSSRTRRPGFSFADPALARSGRDPDVPPRAAADAVSALVNLGYGQAQAGAAVASCAAGGGP